MFNLDKFIADSVASRPASMFEADIHANATLREGLRKLAEWYKENNK